MNPSVDWTRLWKAAALTAGVTGGLLIAADYNYALFHMLVEVFSTVIAFAAFVLIWDARRNLDRDYLLLLGIGLLFFAILDVPHMLSFQGMELFPGFTANLPTQLFVAQRYMLALSFLLAPFFVNRRINAWFAVASYGLVTALVLASVFLWRNFPMMFVEGQGLTPLKVVSEYVIIAIFGISLVMFVRTSGYFRARTRMYIFGSTVMFMASEFMFTLYSSPSGPFNMWGHLGQVGAFALLYGSIVRDGLIEPYGLLYKELADSEERYRAIFRQAGVGIAEVDSSRRFLEANPAFATMLGYRQDEVLGLSAEELTHPQDRERERDRVRELRDGVRDSYAIEKRYRRKDDSYVWARLTTSAIRDSDGHLRSYVGIVEDISARKLAEEERERLLRRLHAIDRITDVALNTLVLGELFESLLDRLIEVIGADGAVLMVREGDVLTVACIRGFGGMTSQLSIAMGEGIAGEVAATGEPLFIEHLEGDARLRLTMLRDVGVTSLMTVPLRQGGSVVGVVQIGWVGCHEYDADELRLLDLAGERIALAYRNAALFQGEHEVAETLQEGLLSGAADIEGVDIAHVYRSASEQSRVGGDFYDAFDLSNDRVGVLIGDVSGKGVGAATLTGVVRNTIRVHASQGVSPAQAVARTNSILVRQTAEDVFVTLLLVVLDRRTGRLVYCNAGHPTGVIKKADGDTVLLPANSPLVGAFEGIEYHEDELTIDCGDELFLYTDGLVEARRGRELFGEARVARAIGDALAPALNDQLDSVLNSVMAFAGGELSDDVAALVVRLCT